MKVKKSEIQLLIAVLGILLAVVTYFLVYAKFNDLADSMESQNMSLRSQVSTLEVLDQRKADYLAATEKMQSYITNFESRFPVDILPEDSIMMVKNMEDATEPRWRISPLERRQRFHILRRRKVALLWIMQQQMHRQIPPQRKRMPQCPGRIRPQL